MATAAGHRVADAVVVGAGALGLAAAMHLGRAGAGRVVVLDPRPPMSLTSSRSTECYRNLFDTPEMVAFMARSIDGMEQHARDSDNVFRMTRRGYLFVSEDPATETAYRQAATSAAASGAGPVREHDHYGLNVSAVSYVPHRTPDTAPDANETGFDILRGTNCIQRYFPYLSPGLVVALHARRAGWVNAHLYGNYMREQAVAAGATVLRAELTGATWTTTANGTPMLESVTARTGDGEPVTIATSTVVNASGPFLNETHRRLCGPRASLPVANELHAKISFAVPRELEPPTAYAERAATEPWRALPLGQQLGAHAPMVILSDAIPAPWDAEDSFADMLNSEDAGGFVRQRQLLEALKGVLPAGLHFRPYGSDSLLALWEFMHLYTDVADPPTVDLDPLFEPLYAEIVQRGLVRLVPQLQRAVGRARAYVDGGYYLKAVDKLPVVGPVDSERLPGVHLCGGLGGQGIMGAEAAGDLVARHITKGALPSYARALNPERLLSASYTASLKDLADRSSTLGSLRVSRSDSR